MNPLFDLEEDPDNPDVLYIAGDYGIQVTIDQGKTWTNFSTGAPSVVVRDLFIQKRDRDLVIGSYGRGIYIADIAPIKEFKPEVFQKDAYLFNVEDTIRWNRFERRGETLGEFAKVDNPPIGSTIYYYLKGEAKSVKLTVKDLEGNVMQEITGAAKKGLQKVAWNLTRTPAGGQAAGQRGAGGGGGQRGMGGARADAGIYKVTLNVDGKDIETKKLNVFPDPMFK
jgi:hypothetical protein